jgi:hypothetical protein
VRVEVGEGARVLMGRIVGVGGALVGLSAMAVGRTNGLDNGGKDGCNQKKAKIIYTIKFAKTSLARRSFCFAVISQYPGIEIDEPAIKLYRK